LRIAQHGTGWREITIWLNRTIAIAGHHQRGDANMPGQLTISTSYEFEAGDEVELAIWQNTGAGLNIWAQPQYSPEFTIQRIG